MFILVELFIKKLRRSLTYMEELYIIQPPKKIVVARFITFHHHTTAAEDALEMQQAM